MIDWLIGVLNILFTDRLLECAKYHTCRERHNTIIIGCLPSGTPRKGATATIIIPGANACWHLCSMVLIVFGDSCITLQWWKMALKPLLSEHYLVPFEHSLILKYAMWPHFDTIETQLKTVENRQYLPVFQSATNSTNSQFVFENGIKIIWHMPFLFLTHSVSATRNNLRRLQR